MTIYDLIDEVRQHFWMPDPGPFLVALAAYLSTWMSGVPVWVLVVGPTGAGKTAILALHRALPAVTTLDDATKCGLTEILNAAAEDDARQVIEFKDLTNTAGPDAAGDILRVVRGAADPGGFERVTAAKRGGRSTATPFKIGIVGGAMEVVDEMPGLVDLGPRFVYVRMAALPDEDRVNLSRQAAANADIDAMDLSNHYAQRVARFVGSLDMRQAPRLTPEQREWPEALGDFMARCRTAPLKLTRPEPEAPTRGPQALAQLLRALLAMGVHGGEANQIVGRVAVDSIPKTRWEIINVLYHEAGEKLTGRLADQLGLATDAIREVAQALAGAGVLERIGGAADDAEGRGNLRWVLSGRARTALDELGIVGAPIFGAGRPMLSIVPTASTCDLCGETCPPDQNPHPGCIASGGEFYMSGPGSARPAERPTGQEVSAMTTFTDPIGSPAPTFDLRVEVIPETCWGSNVRTIVAREDWDTIRRATYHDADYRCEICGGVGSQHPVEAHERWEYDETGPTPVQRLVGMIALCPACHAVKHYGRSCAIERGDEARAHLVEVNGWDEVQMADHLAEARDTWDARSAKAWDLDLTYLDRFGIAAGVIPAAERQAWAGPGS